MKNHEKGSVSGGHNAHAEMPPVLTPPADRAKVGQYVGSLAVRASVKR